MNRFEGKACIVTGAGEGIGMEIVAQLLDEGSSVIANDLRPNTLIHLEKEMDSPRLITSVGDVSEVSYVRKLVAQSVQSFGRLDGVVANAGLTAWGEFLDYKEEDFERVVHVNLRGTFFLCQAASNHFKKVGGGSLVLISSVCGIRSHRNLAAYGMTKAGIIGLTQALVEEVSPLGIRVNTVAPGATVTPRNLNDDPNYEENWARAVPLNQASSPKDIARAVLFLSSDEASNITGQTLVVDGGWTKVGPTPRVQGQH